MTNQPDENAQPVEPAEPSLKTHDCCPVCGSTKRDGEQLFNYLRAIGELDDQIPASNSWIIRLTDQKKMQAQLLTSLTGKIKIKTIVYTWDVCSDCGTVYVQKTEQKTEEGIGQLMPMPPQPQPMRPNVMRPQPAQITR